MWQFLDNHPLYAAIAIAAFSFVAIGLIILIIKLIRNGSGIHAKIGGNELDFGSKKGEKPSEADIMRDMLILCNSIAQWQKQVDKQIELKTREVIASSIRFANVKIDNSINMAKLDYGDLLKSKKKELTQEDNYQIIIVGFLMDQVREEFKDIICSAIREDHFEDKTQSEIDSIGENAVVRAKIIFESKIDILNRSIITQVSEKNLDKIKEEAAEIIKITASKYKVLKEDIKNIIEKEEKDFKEVLKLKFPNLSEEGIENIVNYYN